jgi:uncharacterized protein YuzB (UPF0349 family)
MAETIEYCLRNVDGETRERLRADTCVPADVDAASDVDGTDADDTGVVERRCLQRCGTCYSEDFLVVDGSLAIGDSHGTLLGRYLPEDDR